MIRSWGSAVLACLLSTGAAAQHLELDEGFLGLDFSVTAGGYFPAPNEYPLWVDDGAFVNQADRCHELDGGVHNLSTLSSFTSVGQLAGKVDAGTLLGLFFAGNNFDLQRVGCHAASVSLGMVAIPDAGTIPAAFNAAVSELLPGGEFYYAAPDGLVKVTTQPAPALATVVTKAEVAALLGVPSVLIEPPVAAPDGQLFFRVTDASLRWWVVDRTPGGLLRKRMGPVSAIPNTPVGALFFLPELDAALVWMTVLVGPGARYPAYGVIPRNGPEIWTSLVPPFPRRASFTAVNDPVGIYTPPMVRGVGGLYSWVQVGAGNGFPRYFLRPQFADFDRDGVNLPAEQDAGTSDLLPDTDGDGFSDSYELQVAHTDPLSAVSKPNLPSADEIRFAPSTLSKYGLPIEPNFLYGTSGPLPVLCTAQRCLDGAGKTVLVLDGGWGPYAFTPDAGSAVYEGPGQRFSLRNLKTGVDQLLTDRGAFPNPLSEKAIFFRKDVGSYYRATEPADSVFQVVDRARATCPVLGNEAELTRCEQLARTPIGDVREVGYDPTTNRMLLVVRSTERADLYGFGENDVVHLADLTETAGLEDVIAVRPVPGGGWLVSATSGTAYGFSVRLDSAFRPLPIPQAEVIQPSYFFHEGLLGRRSMGVLHEPGGASNMCGSVGDAIFVCDSMFGGPSTLYYLTALWVSEYVPMGAAVKPGELLAWAPQEHRGRYGTVDPLRNLEWMLLRIGREGGVLPWLDWTDFSALLSAADRAAVDPDTLGYVLAIGASPDGTHFCLAETGNHRTFELALDPLTRRPASARIASAVTGSGCAYTAANDLALVEPAPATLVVGTTRTPLPALTKPNVLVRVGNTWLVGANREPAQCVGADGVVHSTGVQADALSEAPGGVVWIDEKGNAGFAPVEDFCAGRGATERLIEGANVWTLLYNPGFTWRVVTSIGGALAVRPDGLVFLAPHAPENSSVTAPPFLFYLFPTWAPLDWSRPTAALGPFRRDHATTDLVDINTASVTALALVPGADASGDWGYLQRPGLPLIKPMDAGTEQTDAGSMAPPPKGGCGCAAASPLELLSGLALLTLAARRRG